MNENQTIRVEIWTDIICPWCGLATHRLNQAIGQFEHADTVEVVHRSFILNPSTPIGASEPAVDMLQRVKGLPANDAIRSNRLIERIARSEGITEYHVADNTVGNTALAHELLAHATTRGKHEEAWSLMYAEYFGSRAPIWSVDDLLPLAHRLSLDTEETRIALESHRYQAHVEAEQARARQLGARGVPFLVIDEKFGMTGAQQPERIIEALERAWNEHTAPFTEKSS